MQRGTAGQGGGGCGPQGVGGGPGRAVHTHTRRGSPLGLVRQLREEGRRDLEAAPGPRSPPAVPSRGHGWNRGKEN
ncbi:hypothetical protein DV515_00001613 [Chloebia gouldiae]|uniref:Uncharacterized protein n=1 Tax=Chloebia gouldiae TaxID=44316 RepID=A0A3L8SYK6_CHLGU|nr:hypothetical protein DV515_00001613 [Chloebia gouldiae]